MFFKLYTRNRLFMSSEEDVDALQSTDPIDTYAKAQSTWDILGQCAFRVPVE